ncbi:MAG: endosialidase, partial [Lachnoanaerobaculum sp.]|nr:endosialidase [Lachnoanaerobaculum sp.]
MPVVESLICKEADGKLSFGNYILGTKSKVEDFAHEGDVYKVKTFKEITKLERNSAFVYESVPGSTVMEFETTPNITSFDIYGFGDTQITIGLEEDTEYEVYVDDVSIGGMKTNLSGKL